MAPIASHAAGAGVTLAVEHTHALRADIGFVHTLRDAIDLARRAGIGVCMEINACWGERGLYATIADSIDTIALVQVSDYEIGTRCTPDRLVPGDGDIPLARILVALEAAGYTGDYDLELLGPRIESEGYDSAVPRALTAFDSLLRLLSVCDLQYASQTRIGHSQPGDWGAVVAAVGEHLSLAFGPERAREVGVHHLGRWFERQPCERGAMGCGATPLEQQVLDALLYLVGQVLPHDRVHQHGDGVVDRAQVLVEPGVGRRHVDRHRHCGGDLQRGA